MATKHCSMHFKRMLNKLAFNPPCEIDMFTTWYVCYYDNICTYTGMATAGVPMDPTQPIASGCVKNEDATLLNFVPCTLNLHFIKI